MAPSGHDKRCLETLLRDLSLGGGDGGVGVGVDEAAAQLSVLELGALGGADADAAGTDLGAAGRVAVVVGDAAARGELGVLAVADVLGAGVVGGEGEGGDGDCVVLVSTLFTGGRRVPQVGLGYGLDVLSRWDEEERRRHECRNRMLELG